MKYNKDALQNAVTNSLSLAQVLRVLGIKHSGGMQAYIKELIIKYKIDMSHFLGQGINRGRATSNKLTADDVLVYDRLDGHKEKTYKLRRALVESGVEYKCTLCPLKDTWNDKPLVLQVDHINGNWLDNRKENLRFLCPNCHTQTENFGIKNR